MQETELQDLKQYIGKALNQPSVQLARLHLHCKAVSLAELDQANDFTEVAEAVVRTKCDRLLSTIARLSPPRLALQKTLSSRQRREGDGVTTLYLLRCLFFSLMTAEFRALLGFHQGKKVIYLDEVHPDLEDNRRKLLRLFDGDFTITAVPSHTVCFSL